MNKTNVLLVLVTVILTVSVMKIFEGDSTYPNATVVKSAPPEANREVTSPDETLQSANQHSLTLASTSSLNSTNQNDELTVEVGPQNQSNSAKGEKKKHDAEQITKDPVLVDDSGSLNMELAEVELKSEHFTTYIHGLYDPSDETSLLKQQYLTETLSTLEGLDKYHYTHNCGQKICAVEIENVEDADELIAKLSRAVDLGANLYHKHTDEYGVNSLRVIYNQDTSPTGKSVTFSMEQ